MLKAQFLGGLTLTWDDKLLPSAKGRIVRSMLAYLIFHHQHAHTRDLLIGTFWPKLSEANARRRLSQTLWQISNTLQSLPILVSVSDTVQMNPELPLWVDVEAFLKRHAQHSAQHAIELSGCEACIALYQGEFLAGYYEDWIIAERERLQDIFINNLHQLVKDYKRLGKYEQALLYARRLAAEDPWQEEAHREVMLLCHLLDRDSEALKQYKLCQAVLAEDLAIEPSPEITNLAKEISTKSQSAQVIDLPTPAPHTTLFSNASKAIELPLVGKENERTTLLTYIEALQHGQGALLLLEGEPGVGKTRLLRAIACDAQWRGVEVLWGANQRDERPHGLPQPAHDRGTSRLPRCARSYQCTA